MGSSGSIPRRHVWRGGWPASREDGTTRRTGGTGGMDFRHQRFGYARHGHSMVRSHGLAGSGPRAPGLQGNGMRSDRMGPLADTTRTSLWACLRTESSFPSLLYLLSSLWIAWILLLMME